MTHARSGDLAGSGDASATELHRPSHEDLLTPLASAGASGTIDAIVVPAARPAKSLTTALALGRDLGSPVLVLCSGKCAVPEVIRLASDAGAVAAAADVTGLRLKVTLGAGAVAHEVSPGGKDVDLSLKRNIGLLVARMAGWQRLMFLDDDIRDVDPGQVGVAAAQMDDFRAIGFTLTGQYDNSVVCHAYRDSIGGQATFVGGGAVIVKVDDQTSYFPDVYNEDWLFFLNADGELGRIGRIGSLTQDYYDPYDYPERARTQEFGDCLADGLYALLHERRIARKGDLDYWVDRLRLRRELITLVAGHQPDGMPAERRIRRAAALIAARDTLDIIRPEHFTRFIESWQQDRSAWDDFTLGQPASDPLAALDHLGITDIGTTADYLQRCKYLDARY